MNIKPRKDETADRSDVINKQKEKYIKISRSLT